MPFNSRDWLEPEIYSREDAKRIFPDIPCSGEHGGATQSDLDIYRQQLSLYDSFIPQRQKSENNLLAQGTQILMNIKQQIYLNDNSPTKRIDF